MISLVHSRRERPTTRADRIRVERTLGRAGSLAALAPLVVPALDQLHAYDPGALAQLIAPVLLPLAILVALVLLAGALLLARRPSWGRVGIVVGGLGVGVLGTIGLERHPGRAMMLLIGIVVYSAWIYAAPEADEPGHTLHHSKLARARMAALGTMAAVFLALAFRMTDEPALLAYLLSSLLITIGLGARALGGPKAEVWWREWWIIALLVVNAAGAAALWGEPELGPLALLPGPAVALYVFDRRIRSDGDPLRRAGFGELLLEQPARLLVGTFWLAAMLGAVVLSLPVAATGAPIDLLDAAFTAFSAVCVTGLVVLDTGAAFSGAGQAVILILIQLGGLGIMSFSTAAMVLLGQRLSLKQETAMSELLGSDRRAGMVAALRRMLVITLVAELVGAIVLSLVFGLGADAWDMAIWRGTFTAISAYCNAGFALQADSLIGYQDHPLVLHCVGVLIILGGLGPVVVAALPELVRRRRRRRFELHARIVLMATLVLLVAPAVLIAALEWNHSLAGLGLGAKLHNAWFQSLTTRTAGFNSVDFAAMMPATQTLVETLMFIGGSPGSTAGGVKTTTVFVLLVSVVTVAQGGGPVVWGGWSISHATISRAAAVAVLGALSAAFGLFAIQLTQAMSTRTALFEVVSALGTVGLSIGGTAILDEVGKLIIITCMFLGRVAPLTVFLIFSGRGRGPRALWDYPEQDVSVG